MNRPQLPWALGDFERIVAWDARRPCLFLDFDGTLAPLVPRPELAELPPAVRDLVGDLARRCPVCIASGRALDDLQEKVGLDQVYYAAEHGCQIRGPRDSGQDLRAAMAQEPLGEEVVRSLEERLAAFPGVLIERKRFSAAVHYRQVVQALVPEVVRTVEEVRCAFPGLTLREGKMVVEIGQAGAWNKGHAVRWLLQHLTRPDAPCYPLCLGDDLTDEDMFAAAEGIGTSIVVGLPQWPTRAHYYLRDPEEVRHFLARLARHLSVTGQ
jgi:trehalose-phosphatase